MTQNHWRMGTLEESQHESSEGVTSRSQISITTRKEHLEVDPGRNLKQPRESQSQQNRKPEKREFLKKGSRKFLACTGDANTHRDKQNVSHVAQPANKSKSIGKEASTIRQHKLPIAKRELSKTPEKEMERHEYPAPAKTESQPKCKTVECVPPSLLISRLTSTEISKQETASVVRRVFSDGRVSLYFKQIGVTEEYLGSTMLTQWPHGDWKLQHDGQTIYRLEQLNRFEVNGQLLN